MAFVDDRARPEMAHHIILEEREQLSISGVEEVESFDESSIVMRTQNGSLIIHGSDLHIEKLSLDGGDLLVQGEVDALTYEEEESSSFFSRLFRG